VLQPTDEYPSSDGNAGHATVNPCWTGRSNIVGPRRSTPSNTQHRALALILYGARRRGGAARSSECPRGVAVSAGVTLAGVGCGPKSSRAASGSPRWQGCGFTLGDPMLLPDQCHSNEWERQASGVAPEANIAFAGGFGNDLDLAAAAFDALGTLVQNPNPPGKVDILNASFGGIDLECKIDPELLVNGGAMLAASAEVLFDKGVLVVASAGNDNNEVGADCNMDVPGAVVKTLAVNSYSTNPLLPDCQTDQRNCVPVVQDSATGGADAKINGVNHVQPLYRGGRRLRVRGSRRGGVLFRLRGPGERHAVEVVSRP